MLPHLPVALVGKVEIRGLPGHHILLVPFDGISQLLLDLGVADLQLEQEDVQLLLRVC